MLYIGLDVHQRQSTFCVLDNRGTRLRKHTIHGSWDLVLKELQTINKPFRICFEATTGYGYLFEELNKIAKRVVVAHPGQLRLIFRSKRKNDRVDAEKLAKLLYLDEVPPVYVPSVSVRSWRSMIEHRSRLVREQTRMKNKIRALLRTIGVTQPRNIWSLAGRQWLREVTFPTELYTLQLDMILSRLESLMEMIRRVEKVLSSYSKNHPGVSLLRSIPGIGVHTAEAVVAYIASPDRFSSTRAIGCYFGVVPCQDASASVNRLGHITKEGPSTVRHLVTEAAWQGIRRSKRIRQHYERVLQGNIKRKKIALVATAHYLLRVMLAMLKSGEVWNEKAEMVC